MHRWDLGIRLGHPPIGPTDTDSPRVGTRAALTLQPLLPATGSGETGLSYPDNTGWLTALELCSGQEVTPHRQQMVGGTCDKVHTQDMGPKPWHAGYPLGYCWDQDQGLRQITESE